MAKRKRKQRPVIETMPPTAEREARNEFRSVGMARRVVPIIDQEAKAGHLTPKEHEALSYYRDQASLAEKSPVRSCCDNSPRGGNGPGVAIVSAMIETGRLEREFGQLWELARAVAVDDVSISQWCIRKFGGRERYDCKGRFVAMVPICEKRHKAMARLELKMAARRIMGA